MKADSLYHKEKALLLGTTSNNVNSKVANNNNKNKLMKPKPHEPTDGSTQSFHSFTSSNDSSSDEKETITTMAHKQCLQPYQSVVQRNKNKAFQKPSSSTPATTTTTATTTTAAPTPATKATSSRRPFYCLAQKRVEKMIGDLESIQQTTTQDQPTFRLDELQVGKLLGRGGFASVHEIRGFKISAGIARRKNAHPKKLQLLAATSSSPATRKRFAMKHIPRDVVERAAAPGATRQVKNLLWTGITDLVVETKFLSRLHHQHVIQLHGVGRDYSPVQQHYHHYSALSHYGNGSINNQKKIQDFSGQYHPHYFLILDCLKETLQERIHQQWKPRILGHAAVESNQPARRRLTPWRGARASKKETPKSACDNDSSSSSSSFLLERLSVARDLSDAIAYLHKQRICHRDIKPQNVGFDHDGCLKLFDFGLARQLPSEHDMQETYLLSKMTGSRRYMAPEVARGDPYNQACDVYSFSILLWEMLTCEKPYKDELSNSSTAIEFNRRPPLSFVSTETTTGKATPTVAITPACAEILQGGWEACQRDRWSMETIREKLQALVASEGRDPDAEQHV